MHIDTLIILFVELFNVVTLQAIGKHYNGEIQPVVGLGKYVFLGTQRTLTMIYKEIVMCPHVVYSYLEGRL